MLTFPQTLTATGAKQNTKATRAPLPTDDRTQGYTGMNDPEGPSFWGWADDGTGVARNWMCEDATPGAAVWNMVAANGAQGAPGANGIDGKSAYQVAVDAGFSGSEAAWLGSLRGSDGSDGADGADGSDGAAGKSAYELAVQEGYVGTLGQWLEATGGDVYGPGAATDGHLAVFDGPTGRHLKDGGAPFSGAYGDLTGAPTLGTAAAQDASAFAPASHDHSASAITSGTLALARLPVAASGASSATQVVRADDSRLSDSRTPTAHTHPWSAITGTPTTLSGYGIGDAQSVINGDQNTIFARTDAGNGHLTPVSAPMIGVVTAANQGAARTALGLGTGATATAYVHPNHTGDVTSVGDGAQTIAADAVTNAKLANMATGTLKGRATAGTGDPEDLTATQARGMLNVADGATANSSDATLLARANHTGAQAISTVTGLQTALDGKSALLTYGASGLIASPKRWIGSQTVASGSSSATINISSAGFSAAPVVSVQVISNATPPVLAVVTARTATSISVSLYQGSAGIAIIIGGNTGAALSLFTGGCVLDVTADGV